MTHTDLAIQFNTLIDQINAQTSDVNHLNWTKSGKNRFEPVKKIDIPEAHETLDTDLLSKLLAQLNSALSILRELQEQKSRLIRTPEKIIRIIDKLFEAINQITGLVLEVNLSIHTHIPK